MNPDNLLLLKGDEINQILHQRENEILAAVQLAYQAHAHGNTIMPPNAYLRFSGIATKKRILAKPAYLGENFNVAGIKWIASFPNNLAHNRDRASATLILNSMETGVPTAFMEASIIGIKRTAASAALAAQKLWPHNTLSAVGIVGCGQINYETLRFLLTLYPTIEMVSLHNRSQARAEQFQRKAQELKPHLNIRVRESSSAVLQETQIVSFATSSMKPHIDSLAGHAEDVVLLHLSSRDFSPQLILEADNVVDDVDHICDHQTSLHLAEQQVGHRDFIRTTIGDIFNGDAPNRDTTKPVAIFSPFGLGILDLAVAHLIEQLAIKQNVGTVIEGFLPNSWQDR